MWCNKFMVQNSIIKIFIRLLSLYYRYDFICSLSTAFLCLFCINYIIFSILQSRKSKNASVRPRNRSQYSKGCQFFIYVAWDRFMSCYRLKTYNLTHNHAFGPEVFPLYENRYDVSWWDDFFYKFSVGNSVGPMTKWFFYKFSQQKLCSSKEQLLQVINLVNLCYELEIMCKRWMISSSSECTHFHQILDVQN